MRVARSTQNSETHIPSAFTPAHVVLPGALTAPGLSCGSRRWSRGKPREHLLTKSRWDSLAPSWLPRNAAMKGQAFSGHRILSSHFLVLIFNYTQVVLKHTRTLRCATKAWSQEKGALGFKFKPSMFCMIWHKCLNWPMGLVSLGNYPPYLIWIYIYVNMHIKENIYAF